MQHWNISVKGKVQGVWFRKSTQDTARSIGIKGFVRNEPDGTVYIEAEGTETQLKELEDWCHNGSEEARVTGVETEEGPVKNFKDFKVEH